MIDNPRAFPSQYVQGMSLRDYFAGQVLTGLIASPDNIAKDKEHAAVLCYVMADAMLAERERES